MKRRQFLGFAACGLLTPNILNANQQQSTRLDWRCTVVESLPHNRARRYPVVTDVAIQPQGNLLAIVGDDHYVCLYDRTKQQFVEHLDRHSDWVRSANFSPDGRLLVTAGNDRQLYFWRSSNWKTPASFRTHREAIIDTSISPDGRRIAVVGFGKSAHVYDSEGLLIASMECPCSDMHSVAFSPNGQTLAAGGRNGLIRIWNVADGKVISDIKAHRQRIRSLEFLSEQEIVSAGDDQIVKISHLANGESRQLPRQSAKLYAVKVLENNLLATGGSDNKIHVWQTDDLSKYGTLHGHTGTITSLDASDNILVSGSYDTQVRIWDTRTVTTASHGKPGNQFQLPKQRSSGFAQPAGFEGWNRKIN